MKSRISVRASRRFARAMAEALEPRQLLSGTEYIVNSLSDDVAADGVITLREAIEASNSNTAVNEAPAGSVTETDVIRLKTSGTLALKSGLVITGALEIYGPTSNVAEPSSDPWLTGTYYGPDPESLRLMASSDVIVGINKGKHFTGMIVRPSATVHVQGLCLGGFRTWRTGQNGGAIANYGNLTLKDVLFFYNYVYQASAGGGIYNRGTLSLSDVAFEQNCAPYGRGGALCNDGGTVAMSHVAMGKNIGGDGGAIFNSGSLTMDDVEIGRLWSAHQGRSIFNTGAIRMSHVSVDVPYGRGEGGVYNESGTILAEDCTIAGVSCSGEYAGEDHVEDLSHLMSISGSNARDQIRLTGDSQQFAYTINGQHFQVARSMTTAIRIDAHGGDELTFDVDITALPLVVQADPDDAAMRDQLLASIRESMASGGLRSSLADESHALVAILNRDSQGRPLYESFGTGGDSCMNSLPVDENSILVMLTVRGDADLDGKVDALEEIITDKTQPPQQDIPVQAPVSADPNEKLDASDYFAMDKARPIQQLFPAPAPVSAFARPRKSQKLLAKLKQIRRRTSAPRRDVHSIAGPHVRAAQGRH